MVTPDAGRSSVPDAVAVTPRAGAAWSNGNRVVQWQSSDQLRLKLLSLLIPASQCTEC